MITAVMFRVGDVVAYDHLWLKENGCYDKILPFAAGRVERVKRYPNATLAQISWSHEEIPVIVNVRLLCRAGTRQEREP